MTLLRRRQINKYFVKNEKEKNKQTLKILEDLERLSGYRRAGRAGNQEARRKVGVLGGGNNSN